MHLPSRCLSDLNRYDLTAYLKQDDTILIPMGSCEMHGDHLPFGTDAYNALAVAKRAAALADTLHTSLIWHGYSPQHLRAPEAGMGTITLRASTLTALLYDVARSLIHHGFNRLIFVNGHTSNTKVMDPVMRKLRYETGALLAVYACYGERNIGLIADILENSPEETPGWHGSEEETSVMLAFDSDTVHMERARDARAHSPDWLPPSFGKSDGTWDASFRGQELLYFPMDHDEFCDEGVIGNPLRATADKGDRIFNRFAQYLADAIQELRLAKVEIKQRALIDRT